MVSGAHPLYRDSRMHMGLLRDLVPVIPQKYPTRSRFRWCAVWASSRLSNTVTSPPPRLQLDLKAPAFPLQNMPVTSSLITLAPLVPPLCDPSSLSGCGRLTLISFFRGLMHSHPFPCLL